MATSRFLPPVAGGAAKELKEDSLWFVSSIKT
jgi:hypothetical protein